MKKRVVAYCRVSTGNKKQEDSLENQEAYFKRTINENEDYEYCGIYSDKGISGTSLTKRPNFNRMLIDAGLDIENGYKIVAKPKFDLIQTKNTSRFARNVSVDVILKALAQNNVYIDFLDLHKTTENEDDITYIQIFMTFDERESRDKSKKVLFGIQEGIKRGNIQSHDNFYGYKYHSKPDNRLEIIDSEAEVVRTIFDLYVNKGYGLHTVRLYLIEHNIFTRKGKPFSNRALRIMIENETYTGRAVRQKFTNGRVFNKHSTKKTGTPIIFETDKVPEIIDLETFERAQKVLADNREKAKALGNFNGRTEYAGKLVCGLCGSPYTASTRDYLVSEGRTVRNYACKNKRRTEYVDKNGNVVLLNEVNENGKRKLLCNNGNIYETLLDKELTSAQYTFRLWSRLELALLTLESIVIGLKSSIDKQDLEQAELVQAELDDIQKQREKVLDLNLSNKISAELADKKYDEFNQKETELIERKKALTKTNDEILRDIEEVEQTHRYLKLICDAKNNEIETGIAERKYSRDEILHDIDKILIYPNKKVQFTFKSNEEVTRLIKKHRGCLPTDIAEKYFSDDYLSFMELEIQIPKHSRRNI